MREELGAALEAVSAIITVVPPTVGEKLGHALDLSHRLRTELTHTGVRRRIPQGEARVEVACLILGHRLVHQSFELSLELGLGAAVRIDELSDVLEACLELLRVLDLRLYLVVTLEIRGERVVAHRADVRRIDPDGTRLIVRIAEVEEVVELAIANLERLHPLEADRDEHSTAIADASDRLDDCALDTCESFPDHREEIAIRKRRVRSSIRLADVLVVVRCREDLEWNRLTTDDREVILNDIPGGEPVTVKTKIALDLRQLVPAHMAALLLVPFSDTMHMFLWVRCYLITPPLSVRDE